MHHANDDPAARRGRESIADAGADEMSQSAMLHHPALQPPVEQHEADQRRAQQAFMAAGQNQRGVFAR